VKKRASRLVAIGDLNGAYDALVDILRGTGIVNQRLRWVAGQAELVQLGDLFNRGEGAVAALRLLLRLQREAKRAGGKVTVVLGNHEVMTALGHEGYCTEGEYLSFASARERRAWPERVRRALRRIVKHRPQGVVTPIEPRLEAWKAEHVPGRVELRRALGPRGTLGRALRKLPVAYQSGELLFVHAGLLPEWAKLGVDGLNRHVQQEWARGAKRLWHWPESSLFRSDRGPLWDRSLVRGGVAARRHLQKSLELLGAKRMIVGHTPTATLPGGGDGRLLVLAQGRLIGVDVGLREGADKPRAALIVEGSRGFEWTPQRKRVLWGAGR
jgi:hypothetical protein